MNIYLYSRTYNERINLDGLKVVDYQDLAFKLWNGANAKISIGTSCIMVLNDEETRGLFEELMKEFDGRSQRQSRKLFYFLKNLDPLQPFFLLTEDSDYAFRKCVYLTITTSKISDNLQTVKSIFDSFWNSFKNFNKKFTYLSFGFSGWPEFFGESDKSKRICRFCKRKGNMHFKNIAHAISESLGNKLLICNEECDDCNHSLNKIEDNFMNLMALRRCMFNIHRKESNSIPRVDGLNFVIRPNSEGKADIFLMKEKLNEEHIDYSRPFCYKLVGRPIVTNENIFKALCKIVIDCIPSKYLSHLDQTNRWILSSGDFVADVLPKFVSLHLKDNAFFTQPVLDIFINDKNGLDYRNGPFIVAILYIYDILYIYNLPMVDVDKGFFKYDHNLCRVWDVMEKFVSDIYSVEGKYQLNDTTDWWEAYPWWYWNFNPRNPNIHILPQNDSIFEKCVEKVSREDEINFVGTEDINLKEIKAHASIDINPKVYPGDSEMIDITAHTGTTIVLDTIQNLILLKHYEECNDNEDKVHFITIEASILFSTKNIENHFAIRENTCQIDHKLINLIFDRAMKIIDRETWPALQNTPYRGVKMTKNIDNRRIKENVHVCFGKIEY